MTFARWTFRVAGILGLLGVVPQYFMETTIGRETPPPITHPEFFYGFTGVVIAWQVAFLIIGHDPLRHRPLMIPSMIEKFSFAIAVWVLFAQGRIAGRMLAAGNFDLILGILFVIAFLRTAPARRVDADPYPFAGSSRLEA